MTMRNPTRRANWLGSAFMAVGIAAISTVASAADLFVVEYDQARLLRLAEPASSVIVGNPSIADVTLKSANLVVVTGKTFGATNLIVLDEQDRVVLNQHLIVRQDDTNMVSLQRGSMKSSFNCSPKCEPTLKVGDEDKYYSALAANSQTKFKLSEGSRGGSE